MFSANDTLLLDSPVVRGQAATPARDRTADLARIVRHALKGSTASPLDQAIRSAARMVGSTPQATMDVDDRALMLARRMNVLMNRRAAPRSADPHRETVLGS